jgi:hypothetical protein
MEPSPERTDPRLIQPNLVSASPWRWLEIVFLWVTSIILWATAVAKLASVFGATATSRVLFTADPVFGLLNRNLMLASSALELGTVMAFMSPISVRAKCTIAACLGTVFLGYRLALYMVGFKGWCNCLGELGKALFVDPSVQGGVLTAVGIWMVIGGTVLNIARR